MFLRIPSVLAQAAFVGDDETLISPFTNPCVIMKGSTKMRVWGEAASWRDAISTSENAAIPQTRDGGGEPCPRNSRNSGKIDLHSWQEKWNSRPLPLLNCRIGLLQRPPTRLAQQDILGARLKGPRHAAWQIPLSFEEFASFSLRIVSKQS